MSWNDNDNTYGHIAKSEKPRTSQLLIWLAAVLIIGVALSGCANKEREVPVTELPNKPASAEMPCETLSDAEIIACIKQEDTRDACRKVETNCARYTNLKNFVRQTWAARDGK